MSALAGPADAQRRISLGGKVALAKEILSTYVAARRLLRTKKLPAVVEALTAGRSERAPDARDRVTALRLERAVARTLKLPGPDSRCLMQSLVLVALLSARGIDSALVIGARSGPSFGAHAWVEHDGEPLRAAHEYPVLVRLPGGRPEAS